MNIPREAIREDVEAQFELPNLPRPIPPIEQKTKASTINPLAAAASANAIAAEIGDETTATGTRADQNALHPPMGTQEIAGAQLPRKTSATRRLLSPRCACFAMPEVRWAGGKAGPGGDYRR
jgi:hypothetical protein